MIRSILIANRGEIAVRVARTCREAGIRSVAVFSEADANARHVRAADVALPLGGSAPVDSYLNIPRLLEAARRAGCDAVHPGYGFLSENAGFAAAVAEAGLIFIGPTAETIRQMGDKTIARSVMAKAGVPVVPGFDGGGGEDFPAAAGRIGYPVLVKAAGGGGGRGMRRVDDPGGLAEAVASARREAAGAFGDDRVFLEKYISGARHVEIQVVGDHQGRVLHLLERDCSVQRRHQKILEESPSPLLDEELRRRMGETAVAAAEAAGYRNAGTVEFLVDPDSRRFYFLEMNTRLQVEHPVTEMLIGIDLVALQIRLAAGEPLDRDQESIQPRGHVIECRLYAEDPAAGFVPSPGKIHRFGLPAGPGIRVDAGYEDGDEVPVHYDSMLAKILAAAGSREAAVARMARALAETVVLGPVTNLAYLRSILAHPVFLGGAAATDFVPRHLARWAPEGESLPDAVLIAAAIAEAESVSPGGSAASEADGEDPYSPWGRNDTFRIGE